MCFVFFYAETDIVKNMKVQLDPQTEADLREIAAHGNSSPEILLANMAQQQTQDRKQARYWRERQEDMAAIECYRQTGKHISQEAMNLKLDGMIEKTRILAEKPD